MPTTCSTCGDYIDWPDDSPGRPVRCERCRELGVASDLYDDRVRTESADEPRPRPRRRRRPDPPPRKTRIGLIIGAIVGLLFLVCGGGITLFWLVFLHEIDEPVTAADKQVMVTGEYVASFSDNINADETKGGYSKVRHFDGSREMNYEYDKPDNPNLQLYVSHTIGVERTAKEASDAYGGMQFASRLGLGRAEDVQEVERNDLWSWGDRSRCIMLHSNGQPFGQMFMGVKGRRYFLLVISGLYFNTKDDLKAFLDPMLKKLDGYDG